MTRGSERAAPSARAAFGHWSTATTRWADMDGFGHLNNARYFELIDTAIDCHLQETVGEAAEDPDTIGVFAEASCRFFREMSYPAPIELGVTVERVGRSSIVYRVGLFQGGELAAAEGRVVVVYVDNTDPARPATEVPAAVRSAAEALVQ
jgi:acyl-CoA thioester hydrolase